MFLAETAGRGYLNKFSYLSPFYYVFFRQKCNILIYSYFNSLYIVFTTNIFFPWTCLTSSVPNFTLVGLLLQPFLITSALITACFFSIVLECSRMRINKIHVYKYVFSYHQIFKLALKAPKGVPILPFVCNLSPFILVHAQMQVLIRWH